MDVLRTRSRSITSLTQYGWYHGRVDRAATLALLGKAAVGTFLVRDSSSIPGDFVISVSDDSVKGGCTHYIVNFVNGRYFAGEVYFPSLPAVIEHYQQNTLGRCALGVHVPCRQPLPGRPDGMESPVDKLHLSKSTRQKPSLKDTRRTFRSKVSSSMDLSPSDRLSDECPFSDRPPPVPPGERRPTSERIRSTPLSVPSDRIERRSVDDALPVMSGPTSNDSNEGTRENCSDLCPADFVVILDMESYNIDSQYSSKPQFTEELTRRSQRNFSTGGVSTDSFSGSSAGVSSVLSTGSFADSMIMTSIDECNLAGHRKLTFMPEEAAQAVAVYARTVNAYDPSSLVFEVGDRITVREQKPSGTWVGECNGLVGHFPFTAVQLCRQ